MVDRWLHIDEKNVTTVFNITADCIFVKNGKLQEFGLVENAAQTCSAIVGKSFIDSYESEDKAKKLIGFISSIKKLSIHSLPDTLNPLITKAELVARFDTPAYVICSMTCTSYQNEQLLLNCELNLIIQEIEEHEKK